MENNKLGLGITNREPSNLEFASRSWRISIFFLPDTRYRLYFRPRIRAINSVGQLAAVIRLRRKLQGVRKLCVLQCVWPMASRSMNEWTVWYCALRIRKKHSAENDMPDPAFAFMFLFHY